MERVHLLAPEEPTRNNDLAYQWIDRGIRLDEAEPLVRYALGKVPTNAAYLDTFGWLLYKKGAFADARKWLRRADRARLGDDPVILDHLGDACWRLGAKEEAIEHWSTALELVRGRDDEELVNDDERRVKSEAAAKIDAVRAMQTPKVAPLAVEPRESTDKKGDDNA
jgi:tetratricopeptide (TPR) repeat protein